MSAIQVGAVVGTACVSSNSCVIMLTPKGTGISWGSFERCLNHEGGALMSGVSAFIKGAPGRSPAHSIT